jgi:hypothetical protein
VLGQQDVGGPAGGRGENERDAGRVDAAVPRLGQQDDAAGGRDRPAAASAPGAAQGYRQRAEELQCARGTERDARDGERERQRQAGRHHAQAAAGQQVPAGETAWPRPDQDHQQYACPGQPQSGHVDRAKPAEQVDGQGQPELDARHRRDCHHRPASGPGQVTGRPAAHAQR